MTTITASPTVGITLSGSAYVNPVVINPGVYIPSNQVGVLAPSGSWTIENYGSIGALPDSGVEGISLNGGGSIINHASASIYAFGGAIRATSDPVDVVNDGFIRAGMSSGQDIVLYAGGSITNNSSAVIGGNTAIRGGLAPLTVVNDGTISGGTRDQPGYLHGIGITSYAGGTVTNESGALISGLAGIVGMAVTNDGTIATPTTLSSYSDTGGLGVALSGNLTNQGAGVIAGYTGVLAGGGDVVNAGIIMGGTSSKGVGVSLTSGGTLTNQTGGTISGGGAAVYLAAGGRVIADASAMFNGVINGGTGGVSVLELAGGATLAGMGTSIVNFSTIQFDAGAEKIGGSAAGMNNTTFNGFIPGDTIEITGASDTIGTLSGGTLSVMGTDPVSLIVGNGFSEGDYHATVVGPDTDITVACFAAGARIRTAAGEAPVETLRVGNRVATYGGRLARIVWMGHRQIDCRRYARQTDVQPVRVRAGAFGDGLPVRDLVLSPDHAVFVNGVLVPVRHLINGATIRQEVVDEVTYYHVELSAHDVILAEGLPCESYLDTGNRAAFANGGAETLSGVDDRLTAASRHQARY